MEKLLALAFESVALPDLPDDAANLVGGWRVEDEGAVLATCSIRRSDEAFENT